ncbi:MAG: bifunctional metallophosphatase/5'-nucleotidase [Firmicutes bacterium]|nr:bifunctional metallophosphatase/5'-nucleotidase [Bacillota bacterium]
MRRFSLRFISLFALILIALSGVQAEKLVILHTNDTHSQIEPTEKNLGGIARRKVLIDSVRQADKNVILVDAGDMVQGTLYFTLFGGEVESKLMNYLGYDIQILGNHEFDNGVDSLANFFGALKADKLSTNYDFTTTPLASMFKPYVVKEYGGKRIGFIAINLDPKGMIADKNARGVVYLDGIKAANATAWHLRHNEKVDLVVALTHVGYNEDGLIDDVDLARQSEDIDIIIGGHSHTLIDPSKDGSPQWLIPNAVGRPVLVAQTGKSGVNVGEIVVDLDSFEKNYSILPVDARYDGHGDAALDSILAPYKDEVERYRNFKIGTSQGLGKADWSLVNWMADFVKNDAAALTDKKIDLAIVNKGGVRTDMKKGAVTKGTIMQIFPFDNRTVVLEISGRDLRDALDVMAGRGGDGVSKGVDITMTPEGKCSQILINGEPLAPERTYTVATIDYLARGGDYMQPLTRGSIIAESSDVLYNDMINQLIKNKKTIKADRTQRMHK